MNEDILKKLEQRVNRRSFLRGSGLAAAAVIGLAALPGSAFAQQQPAQDEKKEDEKKDADQAAKQDESKKEEVDEYKITRKDENGKEYRLCPQCGYNMYKQDRTWTCENCGYSYTE
jgi:cytoskeletal protein RodZ